MDGIVCCALEQTLEIADAKVRALVEEMEESWGSPCHVDPLVHLAYLELFQGGGGQAPQDITSLVEGAPVSAADKDGAFLVPEQFRPAVGADT